MKKALPYILIVLEIIAIIFINYRLGVIDANQCGRFIQVPDGLELTLNKDIPVSKDDEEFVLKEGMTFTPISIHVDSVLAMYDANSGSFVNIGVFIDNSPADEDMDTTSVVISWSDIKEQDQLQTLNEEADRKYQDDRNQYIKNGLVRGAGIAIVLHIFPVFLLATGLLLILIY